MFIVLSNIFCHCDTFLENMLGDGEVPPAKSPWSPHHTFVRSRFIVKRLKNMRSKAKSLTEEHEGSFFYHYPEPSSLPFEPSLSYESLPSPREEEEFYPCCSPQKNDDDVTAENIVKDIVNNSMRNKYRSKVEKVTFEEESVRSLSCHGSPKSIVDVAIEKDTAEEKFNRIEISQPVVLSETAVQEKQEQFDLLKEFEEALPEKYSLKRTLFCLYSVTMYRTLLRLSRVPSQLLKCKNNYVTPAKEKDVEVNLIEKELMRLDVESLVQEMLIEQALKALEVSTLTRAHVPQYLEAEKALLMASIKLRAVQQERERLLGILDSEEDLGENSGLASIKNFTITVEKPSAWSSYQFILLAVERDNVKGSGLKSVSEDGQIHFDEPLHFRDLKPDFTIFIYLYGICIKDPKFRFFHRSNERLHLLHKNTKQLKNQTSISIEPGHNFTLFGKTEVQLFHIREMAIVPLKGTQNMSRSQTVKLRGEVYLETHHVGFLDIRILKNQEEAETSLWTRYWFRLTGLDLKGWAYPSQQTTQAPELLISLKKSTSSQIEAVNPFLCVRPYTFSFILKDGENLPHQIFCSADSDEEMSAWCLQLNKAIKAYRVWNLI